MAQLPDPLEVRIEVDASKAVRALSQCESALQRFKTACGRTSPEELEKRLRTVEAAVEVADLMDRLCALGFQYDGRASDSVYLRRGDVVVGLGFTLSPSATPGGDAVVN